MQPAGQELLLSGRRAAEHERPLSEVLAIVLRALDLVIVVQARPLGRMLDDLFVRVHHTVHRVPPLVFLQDRIVWLQFAVRSELGVVR